MVSGETYWCLTVSSHGGRSKLALWLLLIKALLSFTRALTCDLNASQRPYLLMPSTRSYGFEGDNQSRPSLVCLLLFEEGKEQNSRREQGKGGLSCSEENSDSDTSITQQGLGRIPFSGSKAEGS